MRKGGDTTYCGRANYGEESKERQRPRRQHLTHRLGRRLPSLSVRWGKRHQDTEPSCETPAFDAQTMKVIVVIVCALGESHFLLAMDCVTQWCDLVKQQTNDLEVGRSLVTHLLNSSARCAKHCGSLTDLGRLQSSRKLTTFSENKLRPSGSMCFLLATRGRLA